MRSRATCRWRGWSEDTDPFLAMRREMNRLFGRCLCRVGLRASLVPGSGQMLAAPKIDVSETDSEIHVTAEMPGIDEHDVEVLLEDEQLLIIRGEGKGRARGQRPQLPRQRARAGRLFTHSAAALFTRPNQVQAEVPQWRHDHHDPPSRKR